MLHYIPLSFFWIAFLCEDNWMHVSFAGCSLCYCPFFRASGKKTHLQCYTQRQLNTFHFLWAIIMLSKISQCIRHEQLQFLKDSCQFWIVYIIWLIEVAWLTQETTKWSTEYKLNWLRLQSSCQTSSCKGFSNVTQLVHYWCLFQAYISLPHLNVLTTGMSQRPHFFHPSFFPHILLSYCSISLWSHPFNHYLLPEYSIRLSPFPSPAAFIYFSLNTFPVSSPFMFLHRFCLSFPSCTKLVFCFVC